MKIEPGAAAGAFAEDGYTVVRNAASAEAMRVLMQYALSYLHVDGYFELEQETVSFARYADALGEVMLLDLLPVLEREAGFALVPTYSFLRFYTPESRLEKHVDRPSCEISATLTVGYKTDKLWPIFVESGGKDIGVHLDVGDLMLYKGPEVPHWREPLEHGYWLQIFFHYVRADGKFVDEKFDRRDRVGPILRPEAAAA
ncbi:MAG TPA: hypothetical protein VGH80_04490 [Xanthomonadaceae bacterium]|jgi:hypothetical protein